MPLPLTQLATTDTFRKWFQLTNNLVSLLNVSVVADNTVANGIFTISPNSTFNVANVFTVNSSLVFHGANTTFAANVVVSSNAATFNMSAAKFLMQSPNGTFVNSSLLTVNANAIFLGDITVNASLNIAGTLTIAGNVVITSGEIITGPINARQILYSQANAMLVPATINVPQLNDYGPAGIDDCTILNLQTNVDTVLTGLQAPPNVPVGGVVKYIQNVGNTNKITLVSANNSSSPDDQFKMPNNAPVDILPGGSIMVIWTSTNRNWRVAGGGPGSSILNLTVTGNTTLNGALVVANNSQFNGNAQFGNVALFVDVVNNRVGVKTASPTTDFQVNGNTVLSITTINGALSITANVTSSANQSLSNATLVLDATLKNATFGNVFSANSSSQSFIRNLKANTFLNDGSATLANVTITGNTTQQGVFVHSGTSARLVLPVGTNLWAT
jgi:hypothetical protein